ncbi:MAG: large subunit ribosomal protein [Thermoleophilaceae bacterium]|nr:large subunit ribosomal protein [Thermoleophilaceae bacterium]
MATSTRPKLTVDERSERGSRATRRLRRDGLVPGIIYGGEGDPMAFKVNNRELYKVLHGGSAVLDITVDGKDIPVIVKDRQLHPVRGEVMHIDLLQVNLLEKIQSTVAIELEGADNAPGVKEGGVLEQITRELNIEALPTDIPESIVVDVSEMEMLATMTLSEVTAPSTVTLLDDLEETVIATITPPSKVEEPETVEEDPELIGEDGEPIEGDAGDADGDSGDGDSGDGDGGGDSAEES